MPRPLRRLLVASAAVVLVVAGCGGVASDPSDTEVATEGAPALAETPPGPLLLSTAAGLTGVDLDAGRQVFALPGGVATADRATVVAAELQGRRTVVTAYDSTTGIPRQSRGLDLTDGALVPRVATPDGALVALMPPRESGIDDPYVPDARARTTIVVAEPSGTRLDRFVLDGNYEPEAFSVDGTRLFLIQYLPARAPERYRIQQLDLESGEVRGVLNVESGDEQHEMAGVAGARVLARDGERLYTLYTGADRDYAFVHVIDLVEGYTHCIFLPDGMGLAPGTTTLALSPDGSRLYVVDHAAAMVVEADTESVSITRSVEIPTLPRGGSAAAVGTDGTLYTATGNRVMALAAEDLSSTRSWNAEREVLALQTDGDRLAVVQYDGIVMFDPVRGRELERVALEVVVPDAGAPPSDTDVLQCAC
jgi:hypothetical protein